MTKNRYEFTVTAIDELEVFAKSSVIVTTRKTRYGDVVSKKAVRRHVHNLIDAGCEVPGITVQPYEEGAASGNAQA